MSSPENDPRQYEISQDYIPGIYELENVGQAFRDSTDSVYLLLCRETTETERRETIDASYEKIWQSYIEFCKYLSGCQDLTAKDKAEMTLTMLEQDHIDQADVFQGWVSLKDSGYALHDYSLAPDEAFRDAQSDRLIEMYRSLETSDSEDDHATLLDITEEDIETFDPVIKMHQELMRLRLKILQPHFMAVNDPPKKKPSLHSEEKHAWYVPGLFPTAPGNSAADPIELARHFARAVGGWALNWYARFFEGGID